MSSVIVRGDHQQSAFDQASDRLDQELLQAQAQLGGYFQTAGGHYEGVKLRSKLVSPPSFDPNFRFGVNFELSRIPNEGWGGEIRPILAWENERFLVAVNPIVSLSSSPSFEPGGMAKVKFGLFGAGLEYYASLGESEQYVYETFDVFGSTGTLAFKPAGAWVPIGTSTQIVTDASGRIGISTSLAYFVSSKAGDYARIWVGTFSAPTDLTPYIGLSTATTNKNISSRFLTVGGDTSKLAPRSPCPHRKCMALASGLSWKRSKMVTWAFSGS